MIYAALKKLQSDKELCSLLKATDKDTRIYPLISKDIGPCIVYTDSPISDDGRIKVSRLEIRVVDHDTEEYFAYDHIELIIKAISKLLIIEEDKPGYNYNDINVMACTQNGGGSLNDDNLKIIEKFLYFNITWRCL